MTGNKKTIHFLSAADRINYGDLLFPILFEKFIRNKNLIFTNYGLVESNFSYFGGLETKSFHELISNLRKGEILIIGGGEIFFPSWRLLYSYVNKYYNHLLRYSYFRKIDNKLNFPQRILANRAIAYPFTPSPNDFKNKNLKIFYNAVGGVFSKNLKDKLLLAQNLKKANFISVRDKGTYDSLKNHGILSSVSPDSALILSDMYPREVLACNHGYVKDICSKPYIFFQISMKHGYKIIDSITQELSLISKKLGFAIVLCPIGLALGHRDDLILLEIWKRNKSFIYHKPNNIFEIMSLIASSEMFIGTSLHGSITAQSYNVPFYSIFNLRKCADYLDTWCEAVPRGKKYGSFDNREIIKAYNFWREFSLSEETNIQKRKVYNNFNRIISRINAE